jgi:hypothetical protein
MSRLVQEIEEQRVYGDFNLDLAIIALEDEIGKLESENIKYKKILQVKNNVDEYPSYHQLGKAVEEIIERGE